MAKNVTQHIVTTGTFLYMISIVMSVRLVIELLLRGVGGIGEGGEGCNEICQILKHSYTYTISSQSRM